MARTITRTSSGVRVAMLACVALQPAVFAQTQCDASWIRPYTSSTSAHSYVNKITNWDPDGTGPQLPIVVLGGKFPSFGTGTSEKVVGWDGANWASFGAGLGDAVPDFPASQVEAIVALPQGQLVAGGRFSTPSSSATGVAMWNGSSWVSLQGDTNGTVYSLIVLPNGDLVAGGRFGSIGGVSAANIARWNGTQWSALGAGLNSGVYAMRLLSTGELIVGGEFTASGSTQALRVARWSNGQWAQVGAGLGPTSAGGQSVYALSIDEHDRVVAGGMLSQAANTPITNIAEWIPGAQAWSSMGSGLIGPVMSLQRLPTGELFAGTREQSNTLSASFLFKFDGTMWSLFEQGVRYRSDADFGTGVYGMGIDRHGRLLVGGNFVWAGTQNANGFALFGTICTCVADLDSDGDYSNGGTRDGAVSIDDLLFLLVAWESGDSQFADLNADSAVEIDDLLLFLDHFEKGC